MKFAGGCPTMLTISKRDATFRPHRFVCLVHLVLAFQPFGYREAIIISQLPSLRSLHMYSATVEAFLNEPSEASLLPAPCMLTQLASLSLTECMVSAEGLNGISLLTNLHTFSWAKYVGEVPWASISSLPSLKCLTVEGPSINRPLPVGRMTGLEVLDISDVLGEGCWETVNSLTAINSVTKLTCRNGSRWRAHKLTPLHSFTAVQHLVLINSQPCLEGEHCWETLGLMTWLTKLDVKWIYVRRFLDWGYASLLKALRAMTQLACLRLSFWMITTSGHDKVLAEVKSLSTSGVVSLQEIGVERYWPGSPPFTEFLQSILAACLKDAQVEVTQL